MKIGEKKEIDVLLVHRKRDNRIELLKDTTPRGGQNMFKKQKNFSIILLVTVAILLLSGCKSRSNETPGESGQDMFNRLLTYIRSEFEEKNVPGGSIAVITNRILSYSSGIGVKRFDSNDQVDTKTLFVTASAGKMLTAAAVMTLVDEGVVNLDAPVTTYVPYFNLTPPFDPANITVHQLLTHTSGFPGYVEIICDNKKRTGKKI